MKHTAFLLLLALAAYACQNNPEPKTTDVTQTNAPGQAGTTQDTNQLKEAAAKSGMEIAKTDIVGLSKSVIDGSNVSMRSGATVKSEKIGIFEDKESVEVLKYENVQNEGEAILSKSIMVKGSGGAVNLPKGKAVIVEDFKSETNTYRVTYEDPKKGKLEAEIDASAVQTITYATWFNVKRKNGETGWVLGKFLKVN
ncbi:MAG: hypothetical protein H7246_15640 [Phycisphaerae bacterium]|nr:hypothetical protein [Saprospiraceae bacterium]